MGASLWVYIKMLTVKMTTIKMSTFSKCWFSDHIADFHVKCWLLEVKMLTALSKYRFLCDHNFFIDCQHYDCQHFDCQHSDGIPSLHCFHVGKGMCKDASNDAELTCLHFSFSACNQCRETLLLFSHHNIGSLKGNRTIADLRYG